MFPSFILNPNRVRFEGQDSDEKILLLLRAHPITNLSWIFPAILVFFLPFYLPPLISLINLEIPELPPTFLTAFVVINYLLVLVIAFEGFLHWYFNVYIVTNKNLTDVDFHSILFKNIDIAPLKNIEEVNASQGGIIRSIFNYGDVFIQTAGAELTIDLDAVPRPYIVQDFILDRAHEV